MPAARNQNRVVGCRLDTVGRRVAQRLAEPQLQRFALAATIRVTAARVRVPDLAVNDDEGERVAVERDRVCAAGAAVVQQQMVALRDGDAALIELAAWHARVVVLGGVRDVDDLRGRRLGTGEHQREPDRSHFERGTARQAGTGRQTAVYEDLHGRHIEAGVAEAIQHAANIVAPVTGTRDGALLQVDGAATRRGRAPHAHARGIRDGGADHGDVAIDRERHREPASVIGMVADQVDASGRDTERGGRAAVVRRELPRSLTQQSRGACRGRTQAGSCQTAAE